MRRGGIGSAISYVKYMINNTDAERRRALPQYLKREDWETFVDSEGSLDAELRRRVGKAARASLKSPHTSGRKGQARVADELVSLGISIYFSSSMYYVLCNANVSFKHFQQQQHPEREVTRCEIFIKTHYKKDGTASSHHVVKRHQLI